MLIIDSKDCENIDKALKKYKKKFEKSRVLLQLRERQAFIKPSIRRRTKVLKPFTGNRSLLVRLSFN
jgi:small subunit ribosomal protein S21